MAAPARCLSIWANSIFLLPASRFASDAFDGRSASIVVVIVIKVFSFELFFSFGEFSFEPPSFDDLAFFFPGVDCYDMSC